MNAHLAKNMETNVIVSIGKDFLIRVAVKHSGDNEHHAFVSVIFSDGLEVALEKDWEALIDASAPVTCLAGSRSITLDAFTIDEIESAGWLLLIAQGYGPTAWNEARPQTEL